MNQIVQSIQAQLKNSNITAKKDASNIKLKTSLFNEVGSISL